MFKQEVFFGNINDQILAASKRQRPYVNLVNSVYPNSEIFNDNNIKACEKCKIKSLYYRTEDLKLDTELSTQIKKAVDAGIREIFIFCNKDKSLDTISFNKFLAENNIRINLRIATISEDDIKSIRSDPVGKKDMLGFDTIKDYKIIYQNKYQIKLLNNKESDKIITDNYMTYKNELANRFNFKAREPEYIKDSKISSKGIRTTKLKKENLVNQVNVGVENVMQLEQEREVEQETEFYLTREVENDLEIDQDQLGRKLNCDEVLKYARKRWYNTFDEACLLPEEKKPSNVDLGHFFRNIDSFFENRALYATSGIGSILQQDPQIKFITQDAIDLMLSYSPLFSTGINIDNLPIGIAIDTKKGIIFASEKRPTSMPINDGTIDLNYPLPYVTDPLLYSWLPFATKGSMTFDDIYGTSMAPTIKGATKHPGIEKARDDNHLDIPNNLRYYSSYTVDDKTQEPIFKLTCPLFLDYQAQKVELENESFSNVPFYNLTELDKKRLQQIWQELKSRGIEKLFSGILNKDRIKIMDSGYLLEEKEAIFLDKLFSKILPISPNEKTLSAKILFFQELSSSTNLAYDRDFILEDVFEGINFAYDEFKEFLFIENITDEKCIAKLNDSYKMVLKQQLAWRPGKVIVNRIMSTLKLIVMNGGSIEEQMEILYLNTEIMGELKLLQEAREMGVNIIHNFYISYVEHEKHVSKYNPSADPMETLNNCLMYLSMCACDRRPSIDTYTNHFKQCNLNTNNSFKFGIGMYILPELDGGALGINLKEKGQLATCEYVQSTIFNHPQCCIDYEKNLQKLLDDKSLQGEYEHKGHVGAGIVTRDANLTNHFTTNQAVRNLHLLSLNILSSTGNHYSRRYPDQEFSSYSALFAIILDKVAFKKNIMIGAEKLELLKDYNKETASIVNRVTWNHGYNNEVKQKEEAHEKIIALFVKLYEDNPEFNFSEVVALGLVAHLCDESLGKNTIKQAKELLKYKDYFAQVLRILIATLSGIKTENPEVELKERADNIASSLSLLNQLGEGSRKIHDILTDNGKYPENLVFFAVCFGHKKDITAKDLKELLDAINSLEPDIKRQILDGLALAKLPFSQRAIDPQSKFPRFTLSDLKNPDKLKTMIILAPQDQIEYNRSTRFNSGINKFNKMLCIKIDFSALEKERGIVFSDTIKNSSFRKLKKYILEDQDFIRKT